MWARFLAETLVLLAAALVALPVGWWAADGFVHWTSAHIGPAELVLTSPSDYPLALASLSAALALPFVVGWIASLVHRVASRRAPALRDVVLATAVPLGLVTMGVARRVWMVHTLLVEDRAMWSGMMPYVSLSELAIGETGLRWGASGAVLVWAIVSWRARRSRPSASP